MTLTPDQILRLDEVGGKAISTFKDGANKHIQAVTMVDASGAMAGTSDNPITANMKSSGLTARMEVDPTIDVIQVNFDKWWNNKLIVAEMTNAGSVSNVALVPKTNSGVNVQSGSANTMSAVRTRYEIPTIDGIGQTFGFSLRLNSVATPFAGQVSRWGLGDAVNGIFVEWNGTTGVLALFGYRQSVISVNVPSTSWTVPVTYAAGAGLLKDAVIQQWMFKWNWAKNHLQIYLDGTLVMDYKPPRSDPIMMVNGGRPFVQVMASSSGATHYIMLYSLWYLQNGGQPRFQAWKRKRLVVFGVPVAAATTACLLHLTFRSFISIASQSIMNDRAARIRRIKVGSYPTTTDPTHCLHALKIQVWKNKLLTGAGTAIPVETPYSPVDAWNGMATPISVVVSGTNATIGGYPANSTVRYQITVLGARGESVPITGPAAVNVGSPSAKQIVISLPNQLATQIHRVVAFKIYRQLNGAGNYQLIGWADPIRFYQVGFVDNGYFSSAGQLPPGTNTQEGDTFMTANVLPTIVGGPAAIPGGCVETIVTSGSHGSKTIDYEDGALMMYPGETLSFIQDTTPAAVTVGSEVTVEWDEE